MKKDTFITIEDDLFSIINIIIEKLLYRFSEALEQYKEVYRCSETFLSISFFKNFVLKHHKKQCLAFSKAIEKKGTDSFAEYLDRIQSLSKTEC